MRPLLFTNLYIKCPLSTYIVPLNAYTPHFLDASYLSVAELFIPLLITNIIELLHILPAQDLNWEGEGSTMQEWIMQRDINESV